MRLIFTNIASLDFDPLKKIFYQYIHWLKDSSIYYLYHTMLVAHLIFGVVLYGLGLVQRWINLVLINF